MNARLPTPTTLTPDVLVQQWSRKLHGLAYTTGVEFDDVRQEAWVIAAEMDAAGELEIGCWLVAVERHVKKQSNGVNRYPSEDDGPYIGSAWLAGSGGDDPCAAACAAESIALRIGGKDADDAARWRRVQQEIMLARESWEIAAERKVSKRQGRRDAAKIRAARMVQRDLFAHDESGGAE